MKCPMLLFVYLGLVLTCSAHVTTVIRNTTLGQVLGSMASSLPDTVHVEKYFGIPFAKPPVGSLRFEKPEEMSSWDPEILSTLALHPACPQIDEDMSYIAEHRVDFNHTDEDCLYLNVFVPVLTNTTKTLVPRDANDTTIPVGTIYGQVDADPLAVLVFIHGGSNVVGTANMFDGDLLAAAGGIIVVTINYRLAALGFLGTGDEDFPGNYGILDQIAALRWVQTNIAAFNGDPNKVTVMGHSASATDVGILLVSPLAKGLFRTAICQSGSPTSVIATRWSGHDSVKEVLSLGSIFNCTDLTIAGVKECLKEVEVIPLSKTFPIYDWRMFAVIVGDEVLPATPRKLLETGQLNAETLLMGTTRDEGGRWSNNLGGFTFAIHSLMLANLLPTVIDFKDLVALQYTDQNYAENSTTDVRFGSMAFGDALFDAPAVETLLILAARNISLYQYRWEWRSDLFPDPEVTGVPHGVDLFYLFGAPLRGHPLYNYTENDRNMSLIMMRQWSHFVKFSSFDVSRVNWPTQQVSQPRQEDIPYNHSTKAYTRFYSIDGFPAVDQGFNLKPRLTTFWTEIIPDIYDQLNRTLSNWNPNPVTPTSPRPGSKDPSVDVDELGKQKNIFMILFIIFLVLSCLLLFLLMFICVLFCSAKNSNKYALK